MALLSPDDLKALARPSLIEEFDFETILQRRKDVFVLAAQAAGLDIGEFIMLESATETILLEEAAYSEMLLRSRINEIYRSRLLYYAEKSELDHVADEHGVDRLANESDADLRNRVRIKNRGSSSAGPDDWWRYHAMTADERVEDVAITRIHFPIPEPGQVRGKITVSVLAQTPDGIPSEEILANVRARLLSTAVRGVTTEVEVVSATSKSLDIAAKIWLLPSSTDAVFASLEATLRSAFAKTRALGWDVTPSWIIAQLQQPGVHRVELLSPTLPVVSAPSEAAKLNSITLTLQGRSF